MLYKYINEGVVEPQPNSIVVGDYRIYNPTEETLKAFGYKELIASEAPSEYYDCTYVETEDNKIRQVWTEWEEERRLMAYPNLVAEFVSRQYSITDELAILRQRDAKPNEFAQYNDYVERCKLSAQLILRLNRQNEDVEYYSDAEALNDIEEAVNNG